MAGIDDLMNHSAVLFGQSISVYVLQALFSLTQNHGAYKAATLQALWILLNQIQG